jgi:hypothetical protein
MVLIRSLAVRLHVQLLRSEMLFLRRCDIYFRCAYPVLLVVAPLSRNKTLDKQLVFTTGGIAKR